MTDPTTANLALAQPLRGTDVGTWDTPLNNNAGILDSALAATTIIPLTNSNVVLSAAQYQCLYITFTGALGANITITLPAVGSCHTIQNRTTGAFTITLATTAAGSEAIACPPFEPFDVLTDGANVRFRNLGRVGTYWDYAGSSVPAWVTTCTVPPYLNCDGTAFSSAIYPALATIFGGTTLPDTRGRSRYSLNQGTGRISAGGNSIDGNTLFAGGGSQTVSQTNLPSVNLSAASLTATSVVSGGTIGGTVATGNQTAGGAQVSGGAAIIVTTTITGAVPLGGSNITLTSPGYAGGLTLVRAA